jgi:DNA-binding beta-propeller fold protein YncE
MGYVLDATTRVIRPVNGIPGSSVLGQPLALPFPVAAAAFSPRGDFALIISASDDHTAHVLRNPGGAPNMDSIDDGISGADRVFLNADASAGVLLASDARQLQLLRGLPAVPTVGPLIDLSSISGTITALAIDSTGSNILIAVSADHGALYLANTGLQIPRLIASFGSPTALALLHGDQDVIVADAAINEITLLRNFAGTPQAFRLAGERDGISGPVGLRISSDSRKLYIANGPSRTLDIWNFEAQLIEASYPLDAEPTRLTPFQGSSTFVLNDVGDHPLLLLDAAIDLAVYFVPAGRD